MKANPVEIFSEAIQLPVGERAAFLDRACGTDEGLRRKIEAMLGCNERAADFLEQPAATIGEGRAKAVNGERPGGRVDRYKLIQQVGEGGCGIVFMAEQEEPVRRRVALKVIKPGMDTKSVIARFEAERQALALMDHPNIARVFDAGTTSSGRPYFVMELVEGVKITDYCDQNSLTTGARLQLFIQVCDAIQHAHQKGIIHRDIKPSNILVNTGSDGKPAPKVIDFGIAKATDGQRLTDKTIFTAHEMLIGTPAYMSPEQAALTSIGVDTRTDIYSLGVLLYELLTGTTPFDTHELLKAGFDEVRRVIRDEDPVRPSTRLSTMVASELANVSTHHQAEAPKLIREMRGDLDWVVMKALEKDRARRYATANGFAMDVGRYLEGETVLARPPSAAYKFKKLAARNKLLFSGVTLVFVLLVVSLIATTRWLMMERGAREQLRLQSEIARLDEKGWDLFFNTRFSEAEPLLLKALELRRQLPQGDLTSPLFNHVIMVQGYGIAKEFDKIKPFVDKFVDQSLLTRPGYKPQIEAAIDLLAENQRWNDAGSLAERLRKAFPDDSYVYHISASLLVARNDIAGYRLLCQEIVTRFTNTTDPSVADKMAKDCLILPKSGVDLKPVAALADLAVARGSNSPQAPYFRCCKALAELRQGHNEQAAKWASLAAEPSIPFVMAESSAIKAIAFFNLGQLNDARAALGACNEVIKIIVPPDPQKEWQDPIISCALRDEAERLIDGVPSSVTLPATADRPQLEVAINDLVQHQKWSDAAALIEKLRQAFPTEADIYHDEIPMLVQANNIQEYRRLCVEITSRFRNATDPYIADRMAKDCVILPSSGADLTVVAALADVAVSRGSNEPVAFYFKFCKAIAEYRLGNYAEAVSWAKSSAESHYPVAQAEDYAVLAMGQFQLGNKEDARLELTNCNYIIETKLPAPGHDLGGDWRDWIIAHALQSEAKKLIGREPSSAALPASLSR